MRDFDGKLLFKRCHFWVPFTSSLGLLSAASSHPWHLSSSSPKRRSFWGSHLVSGLESPAWSLCWAAPSSLQSSLGASYLALPARAQFWVLRLPPSPAPLPCPMIAALLGGCLGWAIALCCWFRSCSVQKICFPVQSRTSLSLLSSLAGFTVESVSFSSICVSRERSPESLPAWALII